jgi:hypothetical protein
VKIRLERVLEESRRLLDDQSGVGLIDLMIILSVAGLLSGAAVKIGYFTLWSTGSARDRHAQKNAASLPRPGAKARVGCRSADSLERLSGVRCTSISTQGGAMKYACLVYLVEKELDAMSKERVGRLR